VDPPRAVVKMNALSAHAGRSELQKFYSGSATGSRLFLVTGAGAERALRGVAKEHSSAGVAVAVARQEVEV